MWLIWDEYIFFRFTYRKSCESYKLRTDVAGNAEHNIILGLK